MMSNKVQKPCKVCGKMYTPCSDCERDKYAFHWRTVACSIECGKEYFRMVEEARKPKVEVKDVEVETITEEVDVVDVIVEKTEKKSSRKKSTKLENKQESEQIE